MFWLALILFSLFPQAKEPKEEKWWTKHIINYIYNSHAHAYWESATCSGTCR